MFDKLKWIWPPSIHMTEADKNRVTASLNIILTTMLGGVFFYALLAPIDPANVGLRLAYIIPTILLLSGMLYATRRGYLYTAATVTVGGVWLLFTVVCFTSASGIHSPAFAGYLMVVVCAGLLLGQRAAYTVAIASIVVGGILVYLESSGGEVIRATVVPAVSLWTAQVVYLLVTAVILNLTLRYLTNTLERLRKSEARQKALLNAMPDMIFELSSDGTFLDYIPAKGMETFIPPEQFLGQKVSEVMPPNVSEPSLFAMKQAYQTGEVQSFEYQLPVENGYYSYESRVVVSGPHTVTAIVRNITNRKQMETALRESEQKFRAIFEQSAVGVVLTKLSGQIIESNAAFQKLLGYTGEELRQKNVQEITYPQDIELQGEIIRHALVSEKLQGVEFDVRYVHKNGRIIWIHVIASFIQNETGKPQYSLGMMEDVSEAKRIAEERETLIKELKAKNEELERFTYTVSHDLKSPLITIRGFLGFVEKDARAGDMDRLKKDIYRIVEATDKMHRLLEDLLELSRIGRITNPPQLVPFSELVQEALSLVSGQIAEQKIEIEVQANLPLVFVDRPRLVEVLQNLIDNAIKFMGNQPDPRIQIGSRQEEGEAIFFVQDNGTGIEPQFQERIFNLFERLDVSTEGTGIGLALVKRIVEVHNGRVWLESEGKDKGSTFYFTLSLPPLEHTT